MCIWFGIGKKCPGKEGRGKKGREKKGNGKKGREKMAEGKMAPSLLPLLFLCQIPSRTCSEIKGNPGEAAPRMTDTRSFKKH